MQTLVFAPLLLILFFANVNAHTAFTLVSSQKKTVKQSEIASLTKDQTVGLRKNNDLTFTAKEIQLIALTGSSNDTLSYVIQGIRNPNLVLPANATLRVMFVNADPDMRHDIRFGHIVGEFSPTPGIIDTAGSEKLAASADKVTYQAEELVIKANSVGAYKYYCSVRGHARDGMWGNILVGVKPGDDLKMAPKVEHVHSPDEDKHDHAEPHPAPKPSASPTPTPNSDHQHHAPAPSAITPAAPSPTPAVHDQHDGHVTQTASSDHSAHAEKMSSSINIGEPMSREGSGSSWLPDSSPQHAWMKMYDDGSMLMLHGTMFLRYTSIGSSRDVSAAGKGSRSRADAPSMFMAMYSKPLTSKSQIGLRAMLSIDPLIERGWGYPLLYQSGETFGGQPLHDRQHPHDFISELAASYSYRIDEKNSFYIYGGLPGEPALGPPMYLHRTSGMNNPDAPIGHHWQDASHITFGVVTAGFAHDRFKLEVSAFNGTEPDEERWGFDKPRLNSVSGRLSFNPTRNWSFQISHGYLKNPERSEPDLKVLRRTTASAIYNKKLIDGRNWANTFLWGQNHTDDGRTNAFLYESDFRFGANSVFGRAEQVQKNAHELVLEHPHPEGNFWVQAYSLGYVRDVFKDEGVDVGIGGSATFNFNPSSISGFYDGTKHAGWQIFLRFRPSARN